MRGVIGERADDGMAGQTAHDRPGRQRDGPLFGGVRCGHSLGAIGCGIEQDAGGVQRSAGAHFAVHPFKINVEARCGKRSGEEPVDGLRGVRYLRGNGEHARDGREARILFFQFARGAVEILAAHVDGERDVCRRHVFPPWGTSAEYPSLGRKKSKLINQRPIFRQVESELSEHCLPGARSMPASQFRPRRGPPGRRIHRLPSRNGRARERPR